MLRNLTNSEKKWFYRNLLIIPTSKITKFSFSASQFYAYNKKKFIMINQKIERKLIIKASRKSSKNLTKDREWQKYNDQKETLKPVIF